MFPPNIQDDVDVFLVFVRVFIQETMEKIILQLIQLLSTNISIILSHKIVETVNYLTLIVSRYLLCFVYDLIRQTDP